MHPGVVSNRIENPGKQGLEIFVVRPGALEETTLCSLTMLLAAG